MIDYSEKITDLGFTIFELLSEALGLNPSYLKELNCAEGLSILGHCYPPCPEPELTMGITTHIDIDFMTILLQDQFGGLQILHDDKWVNVPPVHGALVVNIGGLLQVNTTPSIPIYKKPFEKKLPLTILTSFINFLYPITAYHE
jgi:isopenicillin N synthase-like dioxygenase